MTARTPHADLYLRNLERESSEAISQAAPHPIDSPDFAYWTGRSKALSEAADLYRKMRG